VTDSLKNQFAEYRTKLYYNKQVMLHPKKIKLDEGFPYVKYTIAKTTSILLLGE
jgi:hypothetical protein